jgi:hypothetical protein
MSANLPQKVGGRQWIRRLRMASALGSLLICILKLVLIVIEWHALHAPK